MNVLGETPQHVDDERRMIVVRPHTFGGDASGDPSKQPSLYDAVRHERVMELARQGVTGRRARRLIAQAENRERRRAQKPR